MTSLKEAHRQIRRRVRRDGVSRKGRKVLRRRLPDLFDTLGDLLASGIPIRDALRFQQEMRYPAPVLAYLEALASAVENGRRLGDTPHYHPDAWLEVLLESGEMTGSLAEVLQAWCRQNKLLAEWQNALWKTAAYPILLAVGSMTVLVAITTIIVPRFEGMYLQLGVGIPRQTLIVSRILSTVPYIVGALATALTLAAGLVFFNRERLSPRCLASLRKMPGYSLFRLWRTEQFCFVLGLLTISGIPLAEGLEQIRSSRGPSWMKQAVGTIRDRLLLGESLTQSFQGDWDSMLQLQLQRAALSGNVGEGFLNTESYARSELTRTVNAILRRLEPLLTLLTGGMVAVTMYSLYGPMYALMSTLSGTSH